MITEADMTDSERRLAAAYNRGAMDMLHAMQHPKDGPRRNVYNYIDELRNQPVTVRF